jgi:hypothetical protein
MIRNNVIVDAHASGISMYQIDGGICTRNNSVSHNTIVVAADGRWAINIPNSGCTGNQLVANILYSNHSYRGAINIVDGARSGFASNYNVLEGVFSTNGGDSILSFTQWKALGYDANSRVSTPSALFVNASSDFHLKSGSPAINIGATLSSVKTDFDGKSRPQGASSDAGAFESASPADCRLSPTSGPVYTRVTVTCTGFQSGELVSVRWDGAMVVSFMATSTGSGNATFSAPRSVTGRHLVKSVGDKGTSVPSRGFVIAPSVSLSPTGGVIGQQTTATMRGFAAGEVITLRFRISPSSSRTVAKNIVASSTGTASATFLVPNGSVGKYSIEAAGSLGGFASAPFTRIFGTAELPTATPTATATPSPTVTGTPAPPEPTTTEEPAASPTPTPAPVEGTAEPGGTPIG